MARLTSLSCACGCGRIIEDGMYAYHVAGGLYAQACVSLRFVSGHPHRLHLIQDALFEVTAPPVRP